MLIRGFSDRQASDILRGGLGQGVTTMPGKLWFIEEQTAAVMLSLRVKRTLHEEKTPYQDLMVLDTEAFGRTLVLDGAIQTTYGDEFAYHEMISHVPLFVHPAPRRVAVIGGGDGGAIREILKHSTVEMATLVEIDGRVIDNSREYLPEIAGSLDDPRVELRVEDGIEHVRQRKNFYDVIIVDSTDPVGAAVGLFQRPFYEDIAESLTAEGVMVAQTESPFFNQDLIRQAHAGISAAFPIAKLYLACVPTYPGGLWSFTLGSKKHQPTGIPAGRIQERGVQQTRYYSPALHEAAFVLPRFVEDLIR